MTKTDLILSLIQIIEPKTERDAIIKAAAIQLITPDDFQSKPAEPEHGEPKPKKKGRPPFDKGKMNALLQAGWSVPKIADEMGVSAPTVRKYMREEGYKC